MLASGANAATCLKIYIIYPTVSIESLMLSCTIDYLEWIKFVTVDIPGAFMQPDMD